MSSFTKSLTRLQASMTILLAIILVLFPCATLGLVDLARGQTTQDSSRIAANASDPEVSDARATVTAKRVKIEWRSSYDGNNLGFNVYRLQAGKRTRLNAQVIPGSVFLGVIPGVPPGNRSYQWLDRTGTKDSIYFIESESVYGKLRLNNAVITVSGRVQSEPPAQNLEATRGGSSGGDTSHPAQTEYPAAFPKPESPDAAIDDQWLIASQTALKIYIKADGWYRVTQPQMAAAGFSSAVNIQNLSLFGDGREIAIRTSKATGQLSSVDFIEFYARAIDTSTADTRLYYLITGAPGTGKRVTSLHENEVPVSLPTTFGSNAMIFVQHDLFDWLLQFRNGTTDSSARQTGTQPSQSTGARATPPYIDIPSPLDPQLISGVEKTPVAQQPKNTVNSSQTESVVELPSIAATVAQPSPLAAPESVRAKSVTKPAAVVRATKRNSRISSGKSGKRKRNAKPKYSHALGSTSVAPATFDSTVLVKERYLDTATGFVGAYYGAALGNGENDNYFGRVIATSPVNQTLAVSSFESSAGGLANLEVAIQGVQSQNFLSHQVNVEFNGTQVATLNLDPVEHKVQTISIQLTQIVNGANKVTFRKTSTGEVCIVDYLKLTYPHLFRADSKSAGLHTEALLAKDSLNFSLDSTQSAVVDGFSVRNVRLLDITDPTNVKVSDPPVTSGATHQVGYAITVPVATSGTGLRNLYAIPDGVYKQPAALSLNSPSTLNLASNHADMVIIAAKSLIPSAGPLVSLRQSQGMTVSVVDVEDVYDEFSYGTHGPQAIKDFLSRAKTNWQAPSPKYVIFLGDADLDPRNYEGVGDFDLVPTKLVDATYNETASDDWLTDFDNDGIADIPVGRLPFRTPAEANLVISKIVSFSPSNVPQSALLVADQDDQFHSYQFVEANDAVQAQLPGTMTVQRVNRGISPPSDTQARIDILAALNAARAVVNYSGHGNVNVWTGANIFLASDALAMTNGNKLSFVVVMDCLNGYFQDPRLDSMSESFLKAPAGGAFAAFASSGLTIAQGQHVMSQELYHQLYNNGPTIPLGDAIKIAKTATFDIDVKRTWIFFGDPSMKIR